MREKKNTEMRVKLPTAASMSNRMGISYIAVAAIASAALKDLVVITDDDKANVIGEWKLREKDQEIEDISLKPAVIIRKQKIEDCFLMEEKTKHLFN